MSRWGDGGCFLRGAALKEILLSSRIKLCHRLYTKIEVNIWVTIMSAFVKKLSKSSCNVNNREL